jgi:quercetin dioxygenase-like cupin family protein
MRGLRSGLAVGAALVCGSAIAPSGSISQAGETTKTTPLILEKNEGERRIVRGWPGHPSPGETFILKVDPKNGGSMHLVLFAADIAPGGAIDPHRHPGADEILYLQTGTVRVHLGDATRDVHAGASIFIPANTWISASNIGSDAISFVCVFSAPGFEQFKRETSAREGEKNVPLTPAENDEMEKTTPAT